MSDLKPRLGGTLSLISGYSLKTRVADLYVGIIKRMAAANPTKLSQWQNCILVIFAPKRLADHRAIVVCHAFWWSLALVVISSAGGYVAGRLAASFCGHIGSRFVTWTQVGGAMLLLWGTLFVRGWEIQSWAGDTPVERVNHCIYRALYCVGTAVIVFSLAAT